MSAGKIASRFRSYMPSGSLSAVSCERMSVLATAVASVHARAVGYACGSRKATESTRKARSGPGVAVGAPSGVLVNVAVLVGVFVGVRVSVLVPVFVGVGLGPAVNVSVAVGVIDGVNVCVGVGSMHDVDGPLNIT